MKIASPLPTLSEIPVGTETRRNKRLASIDKVIPGFGDDLFSFHLRNIRLQEAADPTAAESVFDGFTDMKTFGLHPRIKTGNSPPGLTERATNRAKRAHSVTIPCAHCTVSGLSKPLPELEKAILREATSGTNGSVSSPCSDQTNPLFHVSLENPLLLQPTLIVQAVRIRVRFPTGQIGRSVELPGVACDGNCLMAAKRLTIHHHAAYPRKEISQPR